MGEVGIRARCVLRVRALHPRVGGALRVLALRATRLVGEAPLGVCNDPGGGFHLLRRGGYLDRREIHLELGGNIRNDENPVRFANCLEHLRA